jgi:hypothetical protein
MSTQNRINPGHERIRRVLRIVGPAVAGLGLLLTVVGFTSFLSLFGRAFSSAALEGPGLVWCAFLGLPLLFVGGAISLFAFLGALGRYQSAEVAPVVADTLNELAQRAREGVKHAASAMREGIAAVRSGPALCCPKCRTENPGGAKFCSNCGGSLLRTCPRCGTAAEPTAKFCTNCGQTLP